MKRIKIEAGDKTYYAKPLPMAQLEELEEKINGIGDLEAEARTSPAKLPLDLLRAQAEIVLVGLKNHNPEIPGEVMKSFSSREITEAFHVVLSGSGLEEVPEGNGIPVA